MLEYVAMRDIAQGEELFLDYGPAWEAAWTTHVQNWKPPSNAKDYVYPTDMNALDEPFRTVDEQRKNPYPSNLQTVCDTRNWNRDYGELPWRGSRNWAEALVVCNILD